MRDRTPYPSYGIIVSPILLPMLNHLHEWRFTSCEKPDMKLFSTAKCIKAFHGGAYRENRTAQSHGIAFRASGFELSKREAVKIPPNISLGLNAYMGCSRCHNFLARSPTSSNPSVADGHQITQQHSTRKKGILTSSRNSLARTLHSACVLHIKSFLYPPAPSFYSLHKARQIYAAQISEMHRKSRPDQSQIVQCRTKRK